MRQTLQGGGFSLSTRKARKLYQLQPNFNTIIQTRGPIRLNPTRHKAWRQRQRTAEMVSNDAKMGCNYNREKIKSLQIRYCKKFEIWTAKGMDKVVASTVNF